MHLPFVRASEFVLDPVGQFTRKPQPEPGLSGPSGPFTPNRRRSIQANPSRPVAEQQEAGGLGRGGYALDLGKVPEVAS